MQQTIIRILTGIIITALGVSALLGALNIFPFWDVFQQWWPLLVIIGGFLILIGDYRRNYIWGLVTIIIGILLLLKTRGVIDFNLFSLIAPIAIIAAGLSILLHSKTSAKINTTSKDADDISVIFSGSETSNKSKNYQGGKITSILGGATLDLRDATFTGEATLDVFVLMGGVELKVPRDWKVISKAAPIAGGIEIKAEGNENPKSPTLIITGSVTLGGVEVKT